MSGSLYQALVLRLPISIFQILAYAILGTFYLRTLPELLGFESLEINFSTADISKAVVIFLGLPLLAGYATRKWCIKRKGLDWYDTKFVQRISPFALYGLLFTIILMFALQGQAIVDSPSIVAQVALPLLIYFFLMWGISYIFGKWVGMGYEKATTLAFTAAGNNFELAIAVSIGVWGITSGQALVGVIGPLIEVPALVALVYISLWLRKRY